MALPKIQTLTMPVSLAQTFELFTHVGPIVRYYLITINIILS